jgi:hypothetical protein
MIGVGSGTPDARARRRSAKIAATRIGTAAGPIHTAASKGRLPAVARAFGASGTGATRGPTRSALDTGAGRSSWRAACARRRAGEATEKPLSETKGWPAVAARCCVDGSENADA